MPHHEPARHDLERLLAMACGHQALQAVAAAVDAGLFACIAAKSATAETIARATRCSLPAIERLLTALRGLGLVRRRGSTYGLTGPTQRYLSPSSGRYLGYYFLHQATLVEPWSRLSLALKRNSMPQPSRRRIAAYPRQLELYLRAMDCLGRLKTRRIMECLDIRRHGRMLDMGGGIGTYAVACARANKHLRATLVDLPDVVRHARAAIRASGCADRVSAAACRVPDDPLPEGPFDLVLVSNLLHLYRPDECRRMLGRAAAVLERGGVLAVHDYIFGCGDQAASGLFDLTMLVGTPQGRCYKRQDIVLWSRSSGIRGIRAADVLAGTSIIWGKKA